MLWTGGSFLFHYPADTPDPSPLADGHEEECLIVLLAWKIDLYDSEKGNH